MDSILSALGNLVNPGTGGVVFGFLGVLVFLLLIGVVKSIIKVTLPDKLLVVSGKKKRVESGERVGFSVERGRALSMPLIHKVDLLDIGVFPINVRVDGVNSANGITVGADATACVCIDDDDEAMLYSAVNRLMGKDRRQIESQIQQTLIGNFRGALNKATPLQAIGMEETVQEEEESAPQTNVKGERAQFRNEIFTDINSDLSSFGMKVVSVSLQKIWDSSNYIANLAQKTLAEKRKQVEIEEARLYAQAEKAESDSQRRIKIAKSAADEKIIAAREKVEVFRRETGGLIEKTRLDAEHSLEEGGNRAERDVQTQMVALQKLQNQSRVTLQAEAEQKAAEIIAQGEEESVGIIEGTRNDILRQKVAMLIKTGKAGKAVLFMQQQLPHLFASFKEYASSINVDSMLVMDDEKGFNGAVNRGPSAFVDFLNYFQNALGISVQELFSAQEVEK